MEKTELHEFQKKFKRLTGGMTQTEISENIGLSQGLVSSLLRGNAKNTGVSTVVRVADYFCVSTDWLLGRQNEETSNITAKEKLASINLSGDAIAFLSDPQNANIADMIDGMIRDAAKCKKAGNISALDALYVFSTGQNKEKAP